ncbi:HNH endonuclease [Streptomyces sp. NPDC016626]|uniref:HNH endonuclease n=1 Tax=Streptomyces sp. NPDC016626 TaxID=3364968 RepID=UPI003700A013
MAVSKRLRYEVLRRDNHTCRYCGAMAPEVSLTVDHVVPQALGGGDEPSNLVTACAACNSGKTSVPADARIAADVEQDALRWSAAMDKAAANARAKFEVRLDYRNTFREAWDEWDTGPEHAQHPIPLDPNWETSLDNFYEAGLPEWELTEAVRAAMTNAKVTPANTFRYFAGICWTKIRQMQKDARQIVSGNLERDDRGVSQDDVDAFTDRWLAAYQARCKEADIPYRPEQEEGWVEMLHGMARQLLAQGYSMRRMEKAAEEAGQRLTLAVQDFLGGWGDLQFDALLAWVSGWSSRDFDHPAHRSTVPSPEAWIRMRSEIQEAVSAGIPDSEIVSACKGSGELQLDVLTDIPGWDH